MFLSISISIDASRWIDQADRGPLPGGTTVELIPPQGKAWMRERLSVAGLHAIGSAIDQSVKGGVRRNGYLQIL